MKSLLDMLDKPPGNCGFVKSGTLPSANAINALEIGKIAP